MPKGAFRGELRRAPAFAADALHPASICSRFASTFVSHSTFFYITTLPIGSIVVPFFGSIFRIL